MRLKIHLETLKPSYFLPINYMYPLSAAVYKIFSAGSEEVGKWLHQDGFRDDSGKPHKLFNFSHIEFEKYFIKSDSILGYGDCYFIVSSPIETELIETFVNGVLRVHNIFIGNHKYSNLFRIKQVEILKTVQFKSNTYYRTLTPITISTMLEIDGKIKIHYYRPDESGFIPAIINNVKKKYHLLNKKYNNVDFDIKVSNIDSVKSKLITIKEGSLEQTKVKAFNLKMNIITEPEIHKLLYYSGIGEKTSMGFGMLDIVENNEKYNKIGDYDGK